MAIKATKEGETVRILLRGYFKTQKEYDDAISLFNAEGWALSSFDAPSETRLWRGSKQN